MRVSHIGRRLPIAHGAVSVTVSGDGSHRTADHERRTPEMGEAKVGEEFITHEFDEAIAVQESIVDAETTLSTKHPLGSAKRAIKASLADDETLLEQLRTLGRGHDATGKVEDVAGGLKKLMEETLETATTDGEDSDYYEAHAVLLNLKRKQMDSAGGMLAIAQETHDAELRKAAAEFQRAQKSTSESLADELAAYAGKIATATSA
jgi:hypothetical protein